MTLKMNKSLNILLSLQLINKNDVHEHFNREQGTGTNNYN